MDHRWVPIHCGQLDGLCFLVAYQLNSLFIFMMLFLFNVQLRNKYDDDDDDHFVHDRTASAPMTLSDVEKCTREGRFCVIPLCLSV